MSVGPARLHRVAADQIEAGQLKTVVGVSYVWPRYIAQHIRLAAAGRAWTCAPQRFKFQERFNAVVPGNGQLVTDLLDVVRFKTHDVDLAPRSGGFPAAVGDLEIALPCSPFTENRRADAHQRRAFLYCDREILRHSHRELREIDSELRLKTIA
jgi:hypothetical protein